VLLPRDIRGRKLKKKKKGKQKRRRCSFKKKKRKFFSGERKKKPGGKNWPYLKGKRLGRGGGFECAARRKKRTSTRKKARMFWPA